MNMLLGVERIADSLSSRIRRLVNVEREKEANWILIKAKLVPI